MSHFDRRMRDTKTIENNNMAQIEILKGELEGLAADDPGRGQRENQIKGYLTEIDKSYEGFTNAFAEGSKPSDQAYYAKFAQARKDFQDKTKETSGIAFDPTNYNAGKEWIQGTPEYTTRVGEDKAQGNLDTGIDKGVEAAEKNLELGMGAIGDASKRARDEFSMGENKKLAEIGKGERLAKYELDIGEKKIKGAGDVFKAGQEQLGDTLQRENNETGQKYQDKLSGLGTDYEQKLGDIGAETGTAIRDDAANSAIAQKEEFQKGLDNAKSELDPYAKAGKEALGDYQSALGMGGTPFDMSTLENLPGYQFRMQQGLDAVQGAASVRGGNFGGRAMKELQRAGDGIASQEFGRYLGGLADLTKVGYGASTKLTDVGMDTAGRMAGAENQLGQENIRSRGLEGDYRARGAEGNMGMQRDGANFMAQSQLEGSRFKAQAYQEGNRGQLSMAESAAKFGSGGRSAIALDSSNKRVAAINQGSAARASVISGEGISKANMYSQTASIVSSLYGTSGTVGAGIAQGSTGQALQTQFARMEQDLATKLAASSGSSSVFGAFLTGAGAAVGGYFGGSAGMQAGAAVGGAIGGQIDNSRR